MKYIQCIIIGILSIGCIYLHSTLKNEQSIHSQNIDAQNAKIELYKDRLNRSVAEKQSLIVQVGELKSFGDSLEVAIKNIKPKVIIQTKEKIVYRDTVIVKWKDPEKKSFEWSNKWAFFNGKSFNDGIRIDSFGFNDHITIVQGQRKTGLFGLGRAETVVRVVHSNPYVQTKEMKPIVVRPKERFYNKWYFWLGAGIAGGFMLNR